MLLEAIEQREVGVHGARRALRVLNPLEDAPNSAVGPLRFDREWTAISWARESVVNCFRETNGGMRLLCLLARSRVCDECAVQTLQHLAVTLREPRWSRHKSDGLAAQVFCSPECSLFFFSINKILYLYYA